MQIMGVAMCLGDRCLSTLQDKKREMQKHKHEMIIFVRLTAANLMNERTRPKCGEKLKVPIPNGYLEFSLYISDVFARSSHKIDCRQTNENCK